MKCIKRIVFINFHLIVNRLWFLPGICMWILCVSTTQILTPIVVYGALAIYYHLTAIKCKFVLRKQ